MLVDFCNIPMLHSVMGELLIADGNDGCGDDDVAQSSEMSGRSTCTRCGYASKRFYTIVTDVPIVSVLIPSSATRLSTKVRTTASEPDANNRADYNDVDVENVLAQARSLFASISITAVRHTSSSSSSSFICTVCRNEQ